jgi:hypothetical protein
VRNGDALARSKRGCVVFWLVTATGFDGSYNDIRGLNANPPATQRIGRILAEDVTIQDLVLWGCIVRVFDECSKTTRLLAATPSNHLLAAATTTPTQRL